MNDIRYLFGNNKVKLMKDSPIKNILIINYFFVTCFILFSLFFFEVAIGDINREKQPSRSSGNYNYSNSHEIPDVNRTELVVGIMANRFVATGVIVDIKRTEERIQRFVMHIKEIESIENYASYGEEYLGNKIEILSEISIPSTFRPELEVSLILRVAGDERGQYLFLVKVINDDKT